MNQFEGLYFFNCVLHRKKIQPFLRFKEKLILGRAKRDLDQYVTEHKSEIKRAMKGFPKERPSTVHPDLDEERSKLQALLGSGPAQAAESWIKLSNSEGILNLSLPN